MSLAAAPGPTLRPLDGSWAGSQRAAERTPRSSLLGMLRWAFALAGSTPRTFCVGEVLFRKGDLSVGAHLILSGQVRLLLPAPTGEELLLATRARGDLVGEMALLEHHPFPMTAVASQPTEALPISRQVFLDVSARHPELALDLLCSLSARLQETYELIEDVTFLDVAGRLAKKLLQLAEEHGQLTGEGTLIATAITQRDLASMLGVTRETVNKHLRSFRSRGIVAIRSQRMLLVRPDLLRRRIY